jgi:hypothetical protein
MTNYNRRRHFDDLQFMLRKKNASMTDSIAKSIAFSADPSHGVYLQEMMDSKFCLELKGVSPECYRFYESLECGEWARPRPVQCMLLRKPLNGTAVTLLHCCDYTTLHYTALHCITPLLS